MGGGFNIVSHIKRREKVGLVEDWLIGWLVGRYIEVVGWCFI